MTTNCDADHRTDAMAAEMHAVVQGVAQAAFDGEARRDPARVRQAIEDAAVILRVVEEAWGTVSDQTLEELRSFAKDIRAAIRRQASGPVPSDAEVALIAEEPVSRASASDDHALGVLVSRVMFAIEKRVKAEKTESERVWAMLREMPSFVEGERRAQAEIEAGLVVELDIGEIQSRFASPPSSPLQSA